MIEISEEAEYPKEPSEEDAEKERAEKTAKLLAIAERLKAYRKEAYEARRISGIEKVWEQDREFYLGIDDANRHEEWRKPATMEGRLFKEVEKNTSGRSTLFTNITMPYVDTAASRLSDILLPSDDKAFALKPTPIPEGILSNKSEFKKPDGTITTIADEAAAIQKAAEEIAKRSENQIWDWMVEGQCLSEGRKVIKDCAKIGVGILKGPYPFKKKAKIVERGKGGEVVIRIEEKIQPRSCRIDAVNFFPDPACGENIQNGSFVWERDYLTSKQIYLMSSVVGPDGQSEYLVDQVSEVLKEGPLRWYEEASQDQRKEENGKLFEVWFYYGDFSPEDLEAAGCECDREDNRPVPIIATMINDRIIKVALSPLDSGEFPYDVLRWSEVSGCWWGLGVARQVRSPQRMITAATRRMLDNGGLAAGLQIFMMDGVIRPADGSNDYSLTPDKMWLVDPNSDIKQVEHAIYSVKFPSLQKDLMEICKYALELAERVTGMPLLIGGQQGGATKTVGGMTLLQNNSMSVHRSIAKAFDDFITIPHVGRYYEWLLLWGDNDEDKGDSQIQAQGSSVLFERDAQNQTLLQASAILGNPAMGFSPERYGEEFAKAMRLDPKRLKLTEEEKQKMMEAQQGQGADPGAAASIETAQIRAQGEMQKAQLVQQSDMAELEFKAKEAELQRQHDRQMKEFDYQIKLMEFTNQQGMKLDEAKVKLSETVMKLNTQKEMAASKALSPQLTNPVVEPPGRAAPGRAFPE